MKIETLQSLRLGGFSDTLALTSIGGALLLTSPFFNVPWILPAALAGLGGYLITERLSFALKLRNVLPSTFHFESSPPVIPEHLITKRDDTLLLGYTCDDAKPIYLPYEDLMRHVLIVGQSGVGKTVLGSLLMRQQVEAGGGLLFVDGKMNRDDLQAMYEMCAACGREQDLLVINPGNPDLSNTYNPVLYGDADEIASRIISLIPTTETSPGADHFRQSALQAVTTIVRAIQSTGLAFNFLDLNILLTNGKAMAHLQNIMCSEVDSDRETAIKDFKLFIDRFRSPSKNGGAPEIDVSKMKELLGGIAGRLHSFGTGTFGRVLNTYNPEVRLFDAIINNKIIYIMLPTMGKAEAAQNFAKMVIGDYRTAVSWIQALPESQRPNPPFLAFMDEAGSYFNNSFPRLFEQARSARQILMPAAQTFANFEAISPELAEMVLGNTWTKVFFKLGTHETAEKAADMIGMTRQATKSISDSDAETDSAPNIQVAPDASLADSKGITIGMREEEVYLVHPDTLKSLDKGQCIVSYGGDKVYNIRVPMITVSDDFRQKLGPVRINRQDLPPVRGLDLANAIDRFLRTEPDKRAPNKYHDEGEHDSTQYNTDSDHD